MVRIGDDQRELPGESRLEDRVVDSRTVAGGLGSMVLQALYWVKAGWDADRIVAGLNSMAQRERMFFLVDTLTYMQKGGRIGGAAALVGNIMQIKPILTIHDRQVEPYEKIRTKPAAIARVKELVERGCPHRPDAWLSISQCSAFEEATHLAADFKQALGFKYIPIYQVPPAIVVNTGPNVLSVSYFAEA